MARALREWIVALASAACFVLSFPPVGWWWLAPGAYAAIILLGSGSRLGLNAVAALFVSALVSWLILEAWLTQVAALGYAVLAPFMAIYWPLAAWLLRRCRASAIGSRLPVCVLAPVVLVAVEWLRGTVVMDGYPWFMIGHPLIDTPWAQLADLGGVPVVTALVVFVCATVCELTGWCGSVRRAVSLGALVAVLGGAWCYGSWRIGERAVHRTLGPAILAYQTNLPVSNVAPWPRERQESDVADFARGTLGAWRDLADRDIRVDLIVWPETILPGFGLEEPTLATLRDGAWWPGDRFARIPAAIVQATGAPMLVGSPVYLGLAPSGDRWSWTAHYNSAYLVEPSGSRQRYDKVFLTPFGERMPYISAWPWLESKLLTVSAVGMSFDLDEGHAAAPLALEWGPPSARETCQIATPICFEDTVARVVRRMVYADNGVKRAGLIVNLSNDGWFGDSDAGRAHHELMARWRCIELRVPMVRTANTGISGAYDSCGAPIAGAVLPSRKTGSLLAQCDFDDASTVYGKWGEVLSPAMCVIALMLAFAPRARRALAGVASAALALTVLLTIPSCSGDGRGFAPVPDGTWSSRTTAPDPSLIRSAAPTTGPAVTAIPSKPITPPVAVEAASAPPAAPVLESPEISDPVAAVAPAVDPTVSSPTPTEAPSAGAPSSRAQSIVVAASSSDQPIYRAHAIEGLEYCAPEVIEAVARRLLVDPNEGVRFAAAVVVGKRRLVACAELVEPLVHDPNDSVRAAALYALVCLGRIVDLSPLAQLAMSEDAQTRSNAFFVLGELGNPSAIALVESVVGRRLDNANPERLRIVDLQAAESMAKMGDYRQYDPIRAALYAPSEQSEIVALACQMVGEAQDRAARPHLIGIWNSKGPTERPIEVRLIAGASLARIGEPNLEPILQVASAATKDPSPAIRAQAAATLGWVRGERATAVLMPLLDDPVPMVRLTAAVACLRAAGSS